MLISDTFEQKVRLSLTCLRVTLRTSPTYMMRPWWRTMPTVMESSHTSDATYLATWIPKSFSTNSPDSTQTHLFICHYNHGNQYLFYTKQLTVCSLQVGMGDFHVCYTFKHSNLLRKTFSGFSLSKMKSSGYCRFYNTVNWIFLTSRQNKQFENATFSSGNLLLVTASQLDQLSVGL